MRVKLFAILMTIAVFCSFFNVVNGYAREFEHDLDSKIERPELEKSTDGMRSMIATAYCLHGKTAMGTQTREGIAAGKREWFGKTAKVYLNDNGQVGQLIATVTIEDIGGTPIVNGSVIDLWFPEYETCKQFGRKLVYVEIVD